MSAGEPIIISQGVIHTILLLLGVGVFFVFRCTRALLYDIYWMVKEQEKE